MGARNEAGDVEEFDGDGASPRLAGAMVGLASFLERWRFGGGRRGVGWEGGTAAGAGDVEVTNGAVGVYGGEGEVACGRRWC